MQKELLKIDEKEITFACYKTCCESMEQLIKIVEGAFSMDTLGIKDKVRSAGLSKNFKKPKEEWSPMELEVDQKMIVDFIPENGGKVLFVVQTSTSTSFFVVTKYYFDFLAT